MEPILDYSGRPLPAWRIQRILDVMAGGNWMTIGLIASRAGSMYPYEKIRTYLCRMMEAGLIAASAMDEHQPLSKNNKRIYRRLK